MSRGEVVAAEMTDGTRLARARQRFLAAQPVEPGQVRDTIMASWQRSRQWNVAAGHIDPCYVRDPDLDTPLARSALPVLQSVLGEGLEGRPVGGILTDAGGVVLRRLTADRDLERHLDSIQLAPGFSYAEEFAGTNGIGTALESGQAAHVFGHEHYAGQLVDLACAALPIRHPVSGLTTGAVGLTCWRRDAGWLLIALARSIADQITQMLLNHSSVQEFQLLQDYLRACRHTGGIIVALTNDMVIMNDCARDVLDPGDQAALLGHAAQALAGGHRGAVDAALPTGATARMYCRPLPGQGQQPGGGVVHVKLIESVGKLAAGTGSPPRRQVPGLAGSGPLWLRSCDQVDAAMAAGRWLALEGEPGTGKLALLRAVHRRRNPAGTFYVLSADDAGGHDWLPAPGDLPGAGGSLVIRHPDRLTAVRLRALRTALEQTLAAGPHKALWAAVTLSHGPVSGDLAGLLQLFSGTVELPPLRHHIEDLHELVPFFLSKLSKYGPLACSPEAMQLLLRTSWPGNTEQLWQVLRRIVHRRRTGTINVADLPPECLTVSRRLLGPLESMQRDAIVQSLLDYHGDKVKTAESLGMSRATIYRKIHQYGIITPAS
jgi:sigma-54 dependent transcriptional regulator, acetoin dehydrogenase operon transcriptional activator AcoR